jgi:hypothetical protein
MIGSSNRGSIHPPAGARSLEPGDFSFHGFGDLRRDELRKISKLGIRSDPPVVSVVDNAIFVPNGIESKMDQAKVIGGIVGPDGQPIETAQLHRKGGKHFGGLLETVTVTTERELDEDVIYLGPLFDHYGRVLLESLARVWYLRNVDPSVKVVFNKTRTLQDDILVQATPGPWVFSLLSLFGIPLERILSLEEPTRLRRAIVPEPLFEQLYSAHMDMVRPFREVAARIAADVAPSDQPLYLSRRRLTSRERPVVGEPELEDLLREQGFAIAYPETMTIEDQIRLINSHSDVFSSIGSAAHSILFALGKPRLHLLAHRDSVPANFFLCSALADAPTTFVNCLGSGRRLSRKAERLDSRAESYETASKKPSVYMAPGPQSTPQLLEMDRIISYLDQKGFLKNHRATVKSGPDFAASLQRRYDEAWFYARLRKTLRKPGSLPEDLEREALELASEAWPISLVLALYYARASHNSRADSLAKQFAALVEEESDVDRLAYYCGDVHEMAWRLADMCEPETAKIIATVLSNRFPSETPAGDVGVPI